MVGEREVADMLLKKEAFEKAEKEYEDSRILAQSTCEHPSILEGNYHSDTSGLCLHQPPFRVCYDCGYAEEGWHCGYSFLTHGSYGEDELRIPQIDRDRAREFVRGRIIRNDDHTEVRLGRKKLADILS